MPYLLKSKPKCYSGKTLIKIDIFEPFSMNRDAYGYLRCVYDRRDDSRNAVR
jgi:hypothetical protein